MLYINASNMNTILTPNNIIYAKIMYIIFLISIFLFYF